MAALWDTFELYLWNVLHRPGLADIADILVVAAIIYMLLMLTRDTRGSAVLKGLMLLLVLVGISNLVGLTALNWLLMAVINNGPIVLVILFQPEIRKALEQIGRGARIDMRRRDEGVEEPNKVIEEIVRCLLNLSRRRVGALIVFEGKTGLKDIIENGIVLDSKISAGLLENIFEPNTPLHDGAVVIRGERIMSAASFLTLTDASISHDLGTRHRAALGVSETTDATVLIVSEETGIISMAKSGKLMRHLDQKILRSVLESMYKPERKGLGKLLGRSRKEGAK